MDNKTDIFLLRETERDLNKSLSFSFLLNSQINTIKQDIIFIKSILEQQNATPESEQVFFSNAEQQIKQYENALNIHTQKLNNLYSQKKKIQNSLYDNRGYLKNFLQSIEDKKKRLFIKTEKDTSEYITIDKRQSLTKSDLNLFIKKLFLKGLISKNEYRKAIKYKTYSENISNRVYFWNRTLNKTGHKKHTLSNNKRNRAKYEFNADFKRLIKFRSFAIHFKESFIFKEIKHKIKQEKKVYAYFRTTE